MLHSYAGWEVSQKLKLIPNLEFWETAHLPLPKKKKNQHASHLVQNFGLGEG